MKVTVQVVIEAENGTSTIVQEVGQLEREGLQPENLGLKLVEAKHLLQAVQEVLVGEQIRAALARRRRTALGWALEQVAQQAQVSVGMLSLIETGKRRPSPSQVVANPRWLFSPIEMAVLSG